MPKWSYSHPFQSQYSVAAVVKWIPVHKVQQSLHPVLAAVQHSRIRLELVPQHSKHCRDYCGPLTRYLCQVASSLMTTPLPLLEPRTVLLPTAVPFSMLRFRFDTLVLHLSRVHAVVALVFELGAIPNPSVFDRTVVFPLPTVDCDDTIDNSDVVIPVTTYYHVSFCDYWSCRYL